MYCSGTVVCSDVLASAWRAFGCIRSLSIPGSKATAILKCLVGSDPCCQMMRWPLILISLLPLISNAVKPAGNKALRYRKLRLRRTEIFAFPGEWTYFTAKRKYTILNSSREKGNTDVTKMTSNMSNCKMESSEWNGSTAVLVTTLRSGQKQNSVPRPGPQWQGTSDLPAAGPRPGHGVCSCVRVRWPATQHDLRLALHLFHLKPTLRHITFCKTGTWLQDASP